MDLCPRKKKATTRIKARATRYALINGVLCHQSFSGPYQRCVPSDETKSIIEQVHGGICSTHIDGRSLCHRIMTKGFLLADDEIGTKTFCQKL